MVAEHLLNNNKYGNVSCNNNITSTQKKAESDFHLKLFRVNIHCFASRSSVTKRSDCMLNNNLPLMFIYLSYNILYFVFSVLITIHCFFVIERDGMKEDR